MLYLYEYLLRKVGMTLGPYQVSSVMYDNTDSGSVGGRVSQSRSRSRVAKDLIIIVSASLSVN